MRLTNQICYSGRTAAQQRGPTTIFSRTAFLIQSAAHLIFESLNIQWCEVSAIGLFNSHGDFATKSFCVFGFAEIHD
jgi:hypothetical protein